MRLVDSSRVTGGSEPRGSQVWDCLPGKAAALSHLSGCSLSHSCLPFPRHRTKPSSEGTITRPPAPGCHLASARGSLDPSHQGPGLGEGGLGQAQEGVLGALYPLSPANPLPASQTGPLSKDSAISMKTTAQGFPESQALAPPSASCAECLDNWMECFVGRELAGSLGSDFKREGGEDAGSRKRLKRPVVGLEAPRPGLTNTTACPAPSAPAMVGSQSRAQATVGRTGQREEAAEWCQRFVGANRVKSGPEDSLGSGRSQAQDSSLIP